MHSIRQDSMTFDQKEWVSAGLAQSVRHLLVSAGTEQGQGKQGCNGQ